MQWIADFTAPQSSFLIISGIGDWSADYISEWFPAITRRVSVATAQGYEWFPGGRFERRAGLHASLQTCADIACIHNLTQSSGSDYQYIFFVPSGQNDNRASLYQALRVSPEFTLVYYTPEVTIFERR
jgi:hypothetical protein